MKIYLISQDVNKDYDTDSAFVVFAPDEDSARKIIDLNDPKSKYGDWVWKESDIKVEYLGEAKEGAVSGWILGSRN